MTRSAQGKAWASAIAKIPDNATEPLLLTLKALFAGFKETTAVQSGNEEARGGALKSRIKITSDSADQLEQAHQELGNSYNFSDRAKRVERLLLEDLAEAIEKTQCAWAGIKTVFPSIVRVGNDISSVTVGAPPDPGQDGTWVWASTGEACSSYLDALLSWTRNAMRAIEHRTQYEKEYEVLIPLAQDWRGVKALMDKPSLRTLLTKGQNFEVPVGEERFQPGTGRRLIGLGVHWLGKGALTNQLWRVGITVIPPDQSYGDVKIPLSPAYFGHVRDMLTTDELNTTLLGVQSNTNPVGTWHIGWDPYCLNAGDTTDLIGTQVTDVVLILRVRHEPVIK